MKQKEQITEMEKLLGCLAMLGLCTIFLVFGLSLALGELAWWSWGGIIFGALISLSSKIFKEETKLDKKEKR